MTAKYHLKLQHRVHWMRLCVIFYIIWGPPAPVRRRITRICAYANTHMRVRLRICAYASTHTRMSAYAHAHTRTRVTRMCEYAQVGYTHRWEYPHVGYIHRWEHHPQVGVTTRGLHPLGGGHPPGGSTHQVGAPPRWDNSTR